MITKEEVKQKALEIGFADAGFAQSTPFESQREFLTNDYYGWTQSVGIDLWKGLDPYNIFPDSRSIIVLLYSYFESSIPPLLQKYYGRCYLNDDRVTRDGLFTLVKKFRDFLKSNGINSKVANYMPDKLAAMRAGVGTSGKNTLLYARSAAGGSSFVFPVVVLVDYDFSPDAPSIGNGCPSWCRNACIAACPTKALLGNGKINPQRCISYLTYYGEGVTPLELREPMGLYIYGCDRCQNVCPRNTSWLYERKDSTERFISMEEDFMPEKILLMDRECFQTKIWPYMFYMSFNDVWRWRMNAARAMGNSRDERFIPYLEKALESFDDERVRIMCIWALGRIGGSSALKILENIRLQNTNADLAEEINLAMENCNS